jgi:FkbM family methyltransferase
MWKAIQHYANSIKIRSDLFLEMSLARRNGIVLPKDIGRNLWKSPHIFESYIWLLRYFPNNHKITLIDIGGNSGYWAEGFLRFYKNANILAFEPVKEMYNAYCSRFKNNQNVVVFNKALSFEKGENEINVAKDFGLTSFHKYGEHQHERNQEFTRIEKVEIDCLDNYIGNIPIKESPLVVKIDVQGFELNVLRGALEVLENCDALIVECSFLNEFENEPPTFPHITALLCQYDLYPIQFGVYDINVSCVGWERDVLFIKNTYLKKSWGY